MKQNLEVLGGALILVSVFFMIGFTKAKDPFIEKASLANLAEIRAGKLAEEKGNEEVRKIGKEMVKDHTAAENELKALAKKRGLTITTEVSGHYKNTLADLNTLTGKSFDSAYMTSQYFDHKDAIELFSEEANNGSDPLTKAFAGKYLPRWQMHLRMFNKEGSAMKKMSVDSVVKK